VSKSSACGTTTLFKVYPYEIQPYNSFL
jgi:hypothetical protein